ncbi:MAG: dTDP-4-dehydrorhamnose reductase [bacterium]
MGKSTRIMLIGADGQLGLHLQRHLQAIGPVRLTSLTPLSLPAVGQIALDLNDHDQIRAAFKRFRPSVIVNASAYTAVDLAEKERDLAFAINASAVEVMAELAQQSHSLLVHYSTDYVFDGKGQKPLREEDMSAPINVYGESKLAGEQAIQNAGCPHLIFRTSGLFSSLGQNFMLTMLKLGQQRDHLKIVNDQISALSWAGFVASATTAILARIKPNARSNWDEALAGRSGIYHLCSGNEASWFEFADEIFSQAVKIGLLEKSPELQAIGTESWPTPAARPLYSVMNTEKVRETFEVRVPCWEESLSYAMAEVAGLGASPLC